jgi:glycosyltransferase involved in cell wall biosynthesis
MNRADRERLEAQFGPTVAPPLPVELDHFRLRTTPPADPRVIGFSGFVYRSGRKGGALAERLVERFGDRCSFTASGRKWPCPTKLYRWRDVPAFFRGLDLYVSTATIEGGPMPTLEALASGIPVVIGAGVGIHDELPDELGIHRYRAGDADDIVRAVDEALSTLDRVDRAALRRAIEPHSVPAWCESHQRAFATAF